MSMFARTPVARCWRGSVGVLAASLVLMSLSACHRRDGGTASVEPSQVVAVVNGDEVSVHQVQAVLQARPELAALGEAAPGKVLDSLIEQELAAQAARKEGLENSPKVIQALELAKREVLARAYQDHLASGVVMPDSEAVARYYDAHPELFAKRRQYAFQETYFKADEQQAQSLKARIEATGSAQAVISLAADSGLPYSNRNSAQWAENLPMDLLKEVAYLKPGQSIVRLQPPGLAVLTLLQATDAPLTRAQATPAIQAAMMASKRQEKVRHGMDALRAEAKIERKSLAALGMGGAADAASAPPAEAPASTADPASAASAS